MTKQILTQSILKEWLHYFPDTGVFLWRKQTGNGVVAGQHAGTTGAMGYITIRLRGRLHQAHRLAFMYMLGYFPEAVDHLDHNKSNNCWANLRSANHKVNGKNTSISKNNTSGHHGVIWRKKEEKWMAQIKVDYKQIYLGCFEDKHEAIAVRKQAEQRYGFHKNHGASA